jgi:hypothetical protein
MEMFIIGTRGGKGSGGVLTANAALVGDFEVGADAGLGRITAADGERPGCDANGEDGSSDNEG